MFLISWHVASASVAYVWLPCWYLRMGKQDDVACKLRTQPFYRHAFIPQLTPSAITRPSITRAQQSATHQSWIATRPSAQSQVSDTPRVSSPPQLFTAARAVGSTPRQPKASTREGPPTDSVQSTVFDIRYCRTSIDTFGCSPRVNSVARKQQ